MPELEDLRERIDSARQLQSVVEAMKTLANVNIRQYERSVESLRTFETTLEQSFQILLADRPEDMSLTMGKSGGCLGAIVLGSDQGMCGPFNDRIAEFTIDWLNEDCDVEPSNRTVLSAGERVMGRLEMGRIRSDETLAMPGSVDGITPTVQDLLMTIQRWRDEQGIDCVRIFYNKRESKGSYGSRQQCLLPLDEDWLKEIEQRKWPSRGLPTYRTDWRTLFTHTVEQYLFSSLFRAFAESLASENAARLQAMSGAEDNIEDRLDELVSEYHSERQTTITEELLDLTAGYEALSVEEEGRSV